MATTLLLLDSQAALWALEDNPRLGAESRERILDAARVFVSAATVWELTIKSMLGKVTIPDRFSQRLLDEGFALLPIDAEHAEALREFPELQRHDPFDRLILAQAYCEDLDLLTADSILLGLKHKFVLDATR